jgi:hypothetical protein
MFITTVVCLGYSQFLIYHAVISSLELAADYDRARAAQDRATEQATFNYSKRRGIAGEIKQFKEQKAEADKFEKMCRERVSICTSNPLMYC